MKLHALAFALVFLGGCTVETERPPYSPYPVEEEDGPTDAAKQELIDWCGPDAPADSPPCMTEPPLDPWGGAGEEGAFGVYPPPGDRHWPIGGHYHRRDCHLSGPPTCDACSTGQTMTTCCDPCFTCYSHPCPY